MSGNVHGVVREVMRYFLENPDAADSLEGIARWRLMEMQVRDVVAETDTALALLVEQDIVEQIPIAGRRFLFRLKRERLDRVKQLLEEQP